MNSEKLSNWLGVLANFGVLVGILFLVLEMRQNQELMQIQIQQSRSDTAINLNMNLAESEYFFPLMMRQAAGEIMTAEESGRQNLYLRANFLNLENIFLQYQNGMLSEDAITAVRVLPRTIFTQSPFGRVWWQRTDARRM